MALVMRSEIELSPSENGSSRQDWKLKRSSWTGSMANWGLARSSRNDTSKKRTLRRWV